MMKAGLLALILFFFSNLIVMAEQTATSLNDFRWKYRLIIGEVSTPYEIQKLRKQWKTQREALDDRKLALILITPDGIQIEGFNPTLKMGSDVKEQIIRKLKDEEFALVGLDGGVKSRYALKDFSFTSIFGEIDKMPMRVNELRNQSD